MKSGRGRFDTSDECPACGGDGICPKCDGLDCDECRKTGLCSKCDGTGDAC